ncbi:MAG: PIN domain-containing protein, partial [Amylibacter sp.]
MRILLDACVLYPTIMREVLLGAAKAGAFKPVWSARILEEWRRAAARFGAEQAQVAGVEIALIRASWPAAEIAAYD